MSDIPNLVNLSEQEWTELGYKPVEPDSDFHSGDLLHLDGNRFLEIHSPTLIRKHKVTIDLRVLRLT